MDKERRVHQRLMVCVRCHIFFEGEEISGRSYDLSEGGAAIITGVELTTEKVYDLELRWLQGAPSRLRGQVRYSRKVKDEEFMSGFIFAEPVPEQEKQVLRSLRAS
jgi:c-di-GMP-binding flagellar brake protein YcgR